MPKFNAIEGIRGWLAWAVVFAHIDQTLGLDIHGGHWVWMGRGGDTAVQTFIAISGFVITHLIVDKQEPYPRYIVRRACRIFPAYWVAYALAIAVLPLAVEALNFMPDLRDPAYKWDEMLRGWRDAFYTHPWPQIVLHALLLHGVVPDSVLPYSGTAVLGPAWSLTLEWQFYLVAPLMIGGLMSKTWRLPTLALILAGALAVRDGLFGIYWERTFLPGAAYLFLVGIACRLAFAQAQRAQLPPVAAIGCVVLGIVYTEQLWLALWAALYIYLLNGERWRAENSVTAGLLHGALDSKLAQYFGARSYAVYLVHLPLMQLATWFVVTQWRVTEMSLFGAVTLITVPAVLIVSDILHRAVEKPFIRVGARLATPQVAAA